MIMVLPAFAAPEVHWAWLLISCLLVFCGALRQKSCQIRRGISRFGAKNGTRLKHLKVEEGRSYYNSEDAITVLKDKDPRNS
jgi:hypothetical protein